MENQLYCGAVRKNITPREELIGNLRGLMDSHFGGVVDDLYMRVIALKNDETRTLLVSFDLDKAPYPKENMEEIEKHTGIPRDNILFISIHTHSAPVTGDRPYEGPNYIVKKPAEVRAATKKYEEFLRKTMLEAVDEALEKMVPAKYGFGYGKSYINVNRMGFYETCDKTGNTHILLQTGTNFEREADHTLFVMKFEDMQQKPIAFFINYPVHNTVMILNSCGKDGKVGISSDMGGNVSQLMEEAYDGCVAMWSSGAAGDLNPIMSNQVYREDSKTGAPVEYYEKDGSIPLSMLKTLTAHHFADVQKVVRRIRDMSAYAGLSAAVVWSETPGKDQDGQLVPYKIRVHRICIGRTSFIGFSGELYSSIGKMLKKVSPVENMVLINHDASLIYNTGYIYDEEAFELNAKYEGGVVGMNHTWMQPGYAEKSLKKCVLNLLSESRNDRT